MRACYNYMWVIKMKMMMRTKRLNIVPLTDAELEAKMNAESDPEMRKAYGEMLTGAQSDSANRLWYTDWDIRLNTTGETVGDLCFKGPPGERAEVEIGYGINEGEWGRGYATEAAKAAMEWAFSQSGVYWFMAESAPDNAASLRVIEKLGLTPAGEGEEGPRFEKEKPASSLMSIYMCIGMCLGVGCGSAIDNLSIGLCVGLAIGVGLGSYLDSEDKKRRAAAAEKRAATASGCSDHTSD